MHAKIKTGSNCMLITGRSGDTEAKNTLENPLLARLGLALIKVCFINDCVITCQPTYGLLL